MKQAIYFSQLTGEQMNSGESYRVIFSYGTFSAAPKVTQSGIYYSVVRRHGGRLFKVYVGKSGEITREMLHRATMVLLEKTRG